MARKCAASVLSAVEFEIKEESVLLSDVQSLVFALLPGFCWEYSEFSLLKYSLFLQALSVT